MFKVLDEVCTPSIGSVHSACIDLYAREEYSKQIQQQIDKDNEIDRIKQELRNKH